MGNGKGAFWLGLPLLLWMLWFLAIPAGHLVFFSFLQRGPYGQVVYGFSLENYARLVEPIYLTVYLRSVGMALTATAVSLACGFPLAYLMVRSRPALRQAMFTLLMIPFLCNFVVRAYAIKVLLSAAGPLNDLALAAGLLTTPVALTDSSLAVWIGMITNYLPFMTLPIYVGLERFDFSLLEAAQDLGATDLGALRRVLLPLVKPGLMAGSLLVFVPTLGEFMIPDVLGGARSMLLGNLISEQFLKARDWPFGAALVTLLVILMALGMLAEAKAQDKAPERAHA